MPDGPRSAAAAVPSSTESEAALLAAMLVDEAAIPRAFSIVAPDDFFRDPHRRIARVIREIADNGDTVDVITVADALASKGEAQLVSVDYLAGLLDLLPTTKGVETYAQIVKDRADLRRVASACYDSYLDLVDHQGRPARELISNAHERVFDASPGQQSGAAWTRELAVGVFDELTALQETGIEPSALVTGFVDLDRKVQMHPQDLVVVAARPSMGKTALATNIAMHVGQGPNVVVIFSLEMSSRAIARRMTLAEARVSHDELRRAGLGQGALDEDAQRRLGRGHALVAQANIIVDDDALQTPLDLRMKCRRLRAEHGALALVMIDYMQLMDSDQRSDSRQQEITKISRGLKALAKEMDCVVMALSQLSREPERRSNHRPVLADLRDSGAIEQDADVVLMLYRPAYYDSGKGGATELIVAKQRNGPTGVVPLYFHDSYARFDDIQYRQ